MNHKFIQHLTEDHQKQRQLGEQLQEASGSDERQALRQQFYDELYPHMIGEEASLFEYMYTAQGEARKAALEAVQEHHVAKVVLRELMDLSLDSEIFSAKATVLDEVNRHHMEEEEQTHFPMVERMTDKKKMDQLYKVYEEAEEGAQKS